MTAKHVIIDAVRNAANAVRRCNSVRTRTAGTLLAIICCSAAASGNEEDILAVRKVSVTVDGRREFGEVTVTMELTRNGTVSALAILVGGKKYDVPGDQLRDLSAPRLDTIRVLSGVEKSPGTNKAEPALYFEFKTAPPDRTAGADLLRVRVTFRSGHLSVATVRGPAK